MSKVVRRMLMCMVAATAFCLSVTTVSPAASVMEDEVLPTTMQVVSVKNEACANPDAITVARSEVAHRVQHRILTGNPMNLDAINETAVTTPRTDQLMDGVPAILPTNCGKTGAG